MDPLVVVVAAGCQLLPTPAFLVKLLQFSELLRGLVAPRALQGSSSIGLLVLPRLKIYRQDGF